MNFLLTAIFQFLGYNIYADADSHSYVIDPSFIDCVVPLSSATCNEIYEDFDFYLIQTGTADSYKNQMELYQRRCGPDNENSVYVRFINQASIPEAVTSLQFVMTPKHSDCFITNIYSVFSNQENVLGYTEVIFGKPSYVIEIPNTSAMTSLILFVANLGIANVASFVESPINNVHVTYQSDIFAFNPVVYDYALNGTIIPTSYSLPTNQMISILALYETMKKSFTHGYVPESQLKKTSTAIAINEIRSLFCRRTRCCRPVCESKVYCDYVSFVTSCIQVISYCKEAKICPKQLECTKQQECTYECMYEKIVDTCKCIPQVYADMKIDVCTMFEEVFPAYSPCGQSVCAKVDASVCTCKKEMGPCTCDASAFAVEVGVDVTAEVIIGTSVSDELLKELEEEEEEEEMLKSKAAKKKATRRAQPKKKSTTSFSTYGWYVAGGVVAVSVAFVVYVFIL